MIGGNLIRLLINVRYLFLRRSVERTYANEKDNSYLCVADLLVIQQRDMSKN